MTIEEEEILVEIYKHPGVQWKNQRPAKLQKLVEQGYVKKIQVIRGLGDPYFELTKKGKDAIFFAIL
jgi:hypothetical protein